MNSAIATDNQIKHRRRMTCDQRMTGARELHEKTRDINRESMGRYIKPD
jgi:hypothetical protein